MTPDQLVACSQCGELAERFREGVCDECATNNQLNLDRHNHQHAEWERLTDTERDARIRQASTP